MTTTNPSGARARQDQEFSFSLMPAAFGLLFAACGPASSADLFGPASASSSSSGSGPTGCTSGVEIACTCPNGEHGSQTCADDGKKFGSCACDDCKGDPATEAALNSACVAIIHGAARATCETCAEASCGEGSVFWAQCTDSGFGRAECDLGPTVSECRRQFEGDQEAACGCVAICDDESLMAAYLKCVVDACASECT